MITELKTYKWIPLALLAMLTVVACNNGGGSKSASTPGSDTWAQCAGCGTLTNPTALLSNVQAQTADGQIQFNLHLAGQGTGMMQMGHPKAAVYYQGPAALTGVMRISNPGAFCGAPAGDYSIQPVQLSNMYALTLQGGTYQATMGGYAFQFRIVTAQLYNRDGDGVTAMSAGNRIGLNLVINHVAGMNSQMMGGGFGFACGGISTY